MGVGWAGLGWRRPVTHCAFPVCSMCIWAVPGVSQIKSCGSSGEKKKGLAWMVLASHPVGSPLAPEKGSHSLFQGILPIQGSNPALPHCRQILYQLSHKGRILQWVAYPFSSGSFRTQELNWGLLHSAAAAAKSLQSCPILCDSRDGSPPGSAVSGIFQARTLEWVAISFSSA